LSKLPDVGKEFMNFVNGIVSFIENNWVLVIIVGIAIMILSGFMMFKGLLVM